MPIAKKSLSPLFSVFLVFPILIGFLSGCSNESTPPQTQQTTSNERPKIIIEEEESVDSLPRLVPASGPIASSFTQASPVSDTSISDASNPAVPAPTAPAVSTFAPANDLILEVGEYVQDLEQSLATEEDYGYAAEGKLGRDANTLAVIALGLAMHDTDHPYKNRAVPLIQAAQEMAAATDYAAAQKALAAIKAALANENVPKAPIEWKKVAALPDLMKQVPLINTKLKRFIKEKKFKAKEKSNAGATAVIAAIGQASIYDTSEAKDSDQVKQWYEFSIQMRDAAAAVNQAIHSGDQPTAEEAMTKLNTSCDACHAVFHPDAM